MCPIFWITRSWRLQSWGSARRPGRGAAGGSSVDPDTATPVDCGTVLAGVTEHLFRRPARVRGFISSAGLPLLPQALQGRDWRRVVDSDQDDVAVFVVERRTIDFHLLEKRMLLEGKLRLLRAYRRMHASDAAIPAPRGRRGRPIYPCACRPLPSTPIVAKSSAMRPSLRVRLH